MKIEKKYDYLIINGKYYEWSSKFGKPILKEVKESKIKENEKMAEKIAHKLKDNLDAEKLLKEILMKNIYERDLKKLYKLLFQSKRNYKPKTRADHCVDMTIGRFILPLTD